MTSVGLRHRPRPVRYGVTGEDGDTVRCAQRVDVNSQLSGQVGVDCQQPRRRCRRRLPRLVHALQVTERGVVERSGRAATLIHPRITGTERSRMRRRRTSISQCEFGVLVASVQARRNATSWRIVRRAGIDSSSSCRNNCADCRSVGDVLDEE